MAPHIKPKKNSLAIRLTESAVFLRTDYTPTRRNVQPTSSTRNGLLRGLLVLEIVKPTKITSIDVELTGTSSTAWPEGTFKIFFVPPSLSQLSCSVLPEFESQR